VDDRSDVEGSKRPATMGPKEEHMANDESPRVSAAPKASGRTQACTCTSERGPASSRGGAQPASAPERVSPGAESVCDQRAGSLCYPVPQISSVIWGSKGDSPISPMAGRADICSLPGVRVAILRGSRPADQRRPRSDYIWHDKNGSWTTEHLTKILVRETSIRIGIRLTTQDLRHIVIEMGREYIGAEFIQGQPVTEDRPHEDIDAITNAVDLATAHGKDIAERYSIRGDIIRNLSDESIRIFGAIGSQWHQLLGLDSKKPTPSAKHYRVLSYRTPPASLTPKRSRSPIGRPPPVFFIPPLTSLSQTGLFTPINSNTSEPGLSGSGPIVFPNRPRSEIPTTGILPLATVPVYSGEEIHDGLRKVLNQKEPEFRSDEQKKTVFVALDRQTLLIIILPTGGGKTLTFTLPAILRDPGISIVIVPFNTLEKDYVQRLRLAYIEHIVWYYEEMQYTPVVVVNVDQVTITRFIIYKSIFRKRKLLRRVVFDKYYFSFIANDY